MMQKKLKSSKIAAVLACLQLANPLVFAADSSADYNSQDFNKPYYANTETIKKAVRWGSIALGLGTIGVISGIVLNDISNNHSFLEKIRYEFGKDYLKEFEELYNKSLSGHSVADCGRMLEFYNMHFVCLNNLNKSVFDSGFGLYVGHERNPFHVMEDGTYVFIPGADCTSFKEEYFFWKKINKEINHEIDNLRYSCSEDSNYKCDQLSLLSHSISHRLIILEQILENKYDIQGKYNEFGYDRNGYDRNGYDRDGYDRDGYNRKGYDKFGLNKEGKDRNGYYGSKQDRHLYNQFGYDREGYDRKGYDRFGLNKEGKDINGYYGSRLDCCRYGQDGYDVCGYDRGGYDRNGYDREGYDKFGLNKDGKDRNGCHGSEQDRHLYDRYGYDVNGYDREGYDKFGLNKDSVDRNRYYGNKLDCHRYDRYGYDKNGYNRCGYDRDGYDREGYNRDGFNKDGIDRNGYRKSEQEERHVYYSDGYDAFGYDRGGYNRDGFNKDGFNKDGFNKDGFNRYGYDRDGYDRNGYDIYGNRRKCTLTLDAFEKLIDKKDTSSESGEELCNLFEENFAKAQIAGKTRESLEEEYKFWHKIIAKITRGKFSGAAIPDRNKWGYLRSLMSERRRSLQQKINEMKRR